MALVSALAAPAALASPATDLGRFSCTARVSLGTLVCQPLLPTTGSSLELAAVAPAALDRTGWAAPMTLRNPQARWLGTADGRTADAEGVAVRVLGAPVVIDGRGTVRVRTDASQALARYMGVLAPGGTSAAQPWTFDVAEGVEAFTVQVAVAGVATIPAVYASNAAPAARGLNGTNETIAAAVRTATGLRLPSNVYTWSTSDAGVATVSASGEVARTGVGNATVTLSANGVPAAQYPVQVCPNLAVGEVHHFTAGQAPSFCVAGGAAGAAEYTLLPSNTTTSPLSVTVTGSGIQAVTGPPSPSAFRRDANADGLIVPTFSEDDERSNALAFAPAVLPDGFAPQRLQATARAVAVPNVGDQLSYQAATGCSGAIDIRTGTVKNVTDHAIIVADNNNPAGGFTQTQYDSLAARYEQAVWTGVVPTFGTPTDVDGNGRVILFYTRLVNELSPPASNVVVYGEFHSQDLLSTADCPRSNHAEILYMLVPDPTGVVNSNVRTVSSVEGNTIAAAGSQTARMVSQGRRWYATGDTQTEDPWLDMGLASMAEEMMFYRMSIGLAPRQNIVVSNITTGPNATRRVAAFNAYANPNYGRLRPFLQRPDTSGAFRSGTSLTARGVTWAFLRYAVDRRVTEGGVTDASILQTLAGGQPYVGKENLRRALGLASTDELDQWYRDFLVAMYTDDAVAGVAARYTQPSWNFRSVFGGLGGFPLGVRPLTNAFSLTLTYAHGGGTAYQRFGVAQSGFATFTANRTGGDPAPMRFSIVRTK